MNGGGRDHPGLSLPEWNQPETGNLTVATVPGAPESG